jgi:hypothetical protein
MEQNQRNPDGFFRHKTGELMKKTAIILGILSLVLGSTQVRNKTVSEKNSMTRVAFSVSNGTTANKGCFGDADCGDSESCGEAMPGPGGMEGMCY